MKRALLRPLTFREEPGAALSPAASSLRAAAAAGPVGERSRSPGAGAPRDLPAPQPPGRGRGGHDDGPFPPGPPVAAGPAGGGDEAAPRVPPAPRSSARGAPLGSAPRRGTRRPRSQARGFPTPAPAAAPSGPREAGGAALPARPYLLVGALRSGLPGGLRASRRLCPRYRRLLRGQVPSGRGRAERGSSPPPPGSSPPRAPGAARPGPARPSPPLPLRATGAAALRARAAPLAACPFCGPGLAAAAAATTAAPPPAPARPVPAACREGGREEPGGAGLARALTALGVSPEAPRRRRGEPPRVTALGDPRRHGGLSPGASSVAAGRLRLLKAPWPNRAGGAASGLPAPRPGGAAVVSGGARAPRELPWGRQQRRTCARAGAGAARRDAAVAALAQRERLRFREAGLSPCRGGRCSFAKPAAPKHRRRVFASFAPPERRPSRPDRSGGAAGPRVPRSSAEPTSGFSASPSRHPAPHGRPEALS